MSSDLLPSNSTPLERALTQVGARAAAVPVPIRDCVSADACPAALLGYLAWALAVESWDSAWPDEIKREVVRRAIAVHRSNGTPAAIRAALAAEGWGDARLIECFGAAFYNAQYRYDGAIDHARRDYWSSYRVALPRPITAEQAAAVRGRIQRAAPARCHLVGLDYSEALFLYDQTLTHNGQYTYGAG